jgi:hypothetical protein
MEDSLFTRFVSFKKSADSSRYQPEFTRSILEAQNKTSPTSGSAISNQRQRIQKFHAIGYAPAGYGIEPGASLVTVTWFRMRRIVARLDIARRALADWSAIAPVLIKDRRQVALTLARGQLSVDASDERGPREAPRRSCHRSVRICRERSNRKAARLREPKRPELLGRQCFPN